MPPAPPSLRPPTPTISFEAAPLQWVSRISQKSHSSTLKHFSKLWFFWLTKWQYHVRKLSGDWRGAYKAPRMVSGDCRPRNLGAQTHFKHFLGNGISIGYLEFKFRAEIALKCLSVFSGRQSHRLRLFASAWMNWGKNQGITFTLILAYSGERHFSIIWKKVRDENCQNSENNKGFL